MQQQTELHRHLDVSVRPTTLLELAKARGLEAQSTSLDAFGEKFFLRKPLRDLAEVLGQFTLFQKVLDRPEVIERVGFEAVEDCRAEGTTRVELRWSPSFVCGVSGLQWEDALDAFERGVRRALRKFPEMRAGFLCIASRDFGEEEVDRTVEFFLKHQSRFAGLDLAGPEVGYPCSRYVGSFKKAIAAGAKITIHAGEASGPENIWEAIDLLGARRIGHGIASVRDRKLLQELARRGICLEMCPTSNWVTRATPTLEEHPLPKVLRAGVPVCINTDDPGIFGIALPGEIRIAREKMGLTEAELEACQKHAAAASFLN